MTCASAEHCLAYGGLECEPDSVVVYVTHDAQKGADSTWTDATSLVRGSAPDTRLHEVYVVDAEQVWIGGEGGVVMAAGL